MEIEEHVLMAALAQYTDQLRSAPATHDARFINSAPDEEENGTPVISQVLEKTTDEHGVTTMLAADKGLLVTDANWERISTEKWGDCYEKGKNQHASGDTASGARADGLCGTGTGGLLSSG